LIDIGAKKISTGNFLSKISQANLLLSQPFKMVIPGNDAEDQKPRAENHEEDQKPRVENQQEEMITDPSLLEKPFRLRPFEKSLYGKSFQFFPSFPAPLLTDLNTIVQMFMKKKPLKLSEERLKRIDAAMKKYPGMDNLAQQITSVADLHATLNRIRCNAQTTDFNADRYYDKKRVEGYNKKLDNGKLDNGKLDTDVVTGSQANIARACVSLLDQKAFYRSDRTDDADRHDQSNEATAKTDDETQKTSSEKNKTTLKPFALAADWGCGSGLSSESFPKNSFVIGVDASSAMLESAVERCKKLNSKKGTGAENSKKGPEKRKDFILADLSRPLPFRQNVFDAAISVACVHYLCSDQSLSADGSKPPSSKPLGKRSASERLDCLLGYPILNNNYCYNYFQHADLTEEQVGSMLLEKARSLSSALQRNISSCERKPTTPVLVKDFPHQTKAERCFLVGNLGGNALENSSEIAACGLSCRLFDSQCADSDSAQSSQGYLSSLQVRMLRSTQSSSALQESALAGSKESSAKESSSTFCPKDASTFWETISFDSWEKQHFEWIENWYVKHASHILRKKRRLESSLEARDSRKNESAANTSEPTANTSEPFSKRRKIDRKTEHNCSGFDHGSSDSCLLSPSEQTLATRLESLCAELGDANGRNEASGKDDAKDDGVMRVFNETLKEPMALLKLVELYHSS